MIPRRTRLGFRASSSGFKVSGFGLRVQVSGFRVQFSGFRASRHPKLQTPTPQARGLGISGVGLHNFAFTGFGGEGRGALGADLAGASDSAARWQYHPHSCTRNPHQHSTVIFTPPKNPNP